MHLFPGVVDTFSHTHTVRDTLVGSCTISEAEEEEPTDVKFGDLIGVHYIYHWASCSSQAYTVREESMLVPPNLCVLNLKLPDVGACVRVVGDWDVNKVVNYPIQNGDSGLRTMTL